VKRILFVSLHPLQEVGGGERYSLDTIRSIAICGDHCSAYAVATHVPPRQQYLDRLNTTLVKVIPGSSPHFGEPISFRDLLVEVAEYDAVVVHQYLSSDLVFDLVGGLASDDWRFDRTRQFAGDSNGVEMFNDAVVGVAIGSPRPVGLGVAHGWRRSGDPMVVTDSEGLKVYEFDNEPALDVFLARVGLDESVLTAGDSFRLAALEYPLGVATRSGEEIRVIQGVDLADRSVLVSAGIPQGGLAWLMEGDLESLVAGGTDSCQQAVETLGGENPIGLLTFDCAVRRRELGPAGVLREFAEIERIFPGVPFGGFYSYGEIARYRGATGMHHLTMVSLALA